VGSYYGRWVAIDGKRVNRKIGRVRVRGEKGGITLLELESMQRIHITPAVRSSGGRLDHTSGRGAARFEAC